MMNYFSKCSEVHLKINFKKVPIPLIPGFPLISSKNFCPPPPPSPITAALETLIGIKNKTRSHAFKNF